MDEIDDVLQDLAPAYREPEAPVTSDFSFDVDYYKSHYVPVRVIIELRKATYD